MPEEEKDNQNGGSDKVDEIPSNLDALMQEIPFFLPDGADEQTMEILKTGADGFCMTCRAPLGKNTHLILATEGIMLAYCSGACMTDMTILGWIEQQHDDLRDRVMFRGGEGGN